ncbi:MAG: type II toxin-antitoxin system VapC family toxin [Chloroflexi bacterium]|nr:type II toxin-antitoxin system VapC family toxin [Chloroflexota bacterium]
MNQPNHPATFLLDSNIIVKWYHDEEDSPIALALRHDYLHGACELRLADVSFYEFANTLFYLQKYTPEQIIARAQSLFGMDLKIYGFDLVVLRDALDLCAQKNIAIYDAYLVALAKRENLVLVTADSKLLRKLGPHEPAVALRALAKRSDETKE